MTEHHEGGIVKDGKPFIPLAGCRGTGYIIPKAFAERWKEALLTLDKINRGVYNVEVADETGGSEESS